MSILTMQNSQIVKGIRTLRFAGSLALLGAVLVGVFTGSHEVGAVDPRIFGAGAGAIAAIVIKALHLL
jgi:hypothetical protein